MGRSYQTANITFRLRLQNGYLQSSNGPHYTIAASIFPLEDGNDSSPASHTSLNCSNTGVTFLCLPSS